MLLDTEMLLTFNYEFIRIFFIHLCLPRNGKQYIKTASSVSVVHFSSSKDSVIVGCPDKNKPQTSPLIGRSTPKADCRLVVHG